MSTRTLTVVLPVHNQAAELPGTLRALETAVASTGFDTDVVVVDDGSTDGSGAAAEASLGRLRGRVIRQPNGGRFAARRAGLAGATGELVLFVDSRVTIHRGALRFVEEQLDADVTRLVWNAHVDVQTEGNPYGVFWDVITRRAFATYFDEPRTTSFGAEDFDLYPKGTTCFLAPRADLEEAFAAHRSGYADERHGNDDTPIIRHLAARRRINISPGFSCTYHPRRGLRGFARHAFHRGTVFLDGHGRPEARLFPAVLAFYPLSVAWALAAPRRPLVAVSPLAAAAAGGAWLARRAGRSDDAPVLALLTLAYGVAHAAGMWRGLGLLALARIRRRR
jgi:glycosyltransferase involved in cell wall biosynthesis